MNKGLLSSNSLDWCTPQSFFDKLNAEFHFVLDAAASEKSAKCERYFTQETDGLSNSWDFGGAVFCNPPYGREIGKWVKKAFNEAYRGGKPSFCLSQRERTLHIFMTTFMAGLKFGLSGGGYSSQMKKETKKGVRLSRQCS